MDIQNVTTGSVRVMISHDYCHFEIVLGYNKAEFPMGIDELRKEATRLAQKAVDQYKTAKMAAAQYDELEGEWRYKRAIETPEDERTPAEKAVIKFRQDGNFRARHRYDYEDDWHQPEYDDEPDDERLF